MQIIHTPSSLGPSFPWKLRLDRFICTKFSYMYSFSSNLNEMHDLRTWLRSNNKLLPMMTSDINELAVLCLKVTFRIKFCEIRPCQKQKMKQEGSPISDPSQLQLVENFLWECLIHRSHLLSLVICNTPNTLTSYGPHFLKICRL